MAPQTARKTVPADWPDPFGTSSLQIREYIQLLHAAGHHDAVLDEAVKLVNKLDATEKQIEAVAVIQQALREKVDALTGHEHYAVVITDVERNGKVVAEVAGLGHTRVQVAVDPEVDVASLRVGATALVTRERNCLIRVTGDIGRWKDIGRFEKYLDAPHRILLKCEHVTVAVDVAESLRGTPLKQGDLIGFDRDVAGMAYERLEPPKGDHLFDEGVTDDFAQLGGLDVQIARIKNLIDFRFRYPWLAAKYSLKSKCGILLHGAPGNGKTRIARCCAGYVRRLFPDRPCRFMHIAGSGDYTMWLGESEQKIIERFLAVREAAADGMVVMFWDEVDAIARRRGTDYGHGAPDRILSTLLAQMDGVVPLSNVIMMVATNRPDTLDPALLRPGRIDEKIEIPTPNHRGAEAILRRYLARVPLADFHRSADELISPQLSKLFAPNGQYAEVARVKLNDGRQLPVSGRQLLSGAMLENVVSVAAHEAAAREAETGVTGLTEEDLSAAIESELIAAVALLAPGNIKSYVTSIPQEAHPIAVDAILRSPTATFVRLR